MAKHNIVVLLSGRGSNLQALLRAAVAEQWSERFDARIVAVIGSRPDAGGLQIAQAAGLPTALVAHGQYASRAAFEQALVAALDVHYPTLIVLAGFMRILTGDFVARYAGRLVNIHPSLLPAFPGLQTHRRALEAGVRVHGATVHYVTPDVDSGAVIAQAALAVRPDDDEDSLAARVLALEHRLLPRAVRLIVEGRVRHDGQRVVLDQITGDELALLAA